MKEAVPADEASKTIPLDIRNEHKASLCTVDRVERGGAHAVVSCDVV